MYCFKIAELDCMGILEIDTYTTITVLMNKHIYIYFLIMIQSCIQ